VKQILLTKGQRSTVGDEDFEWLSKHEWKAVWCESTKSFYSYRYERRDGKQYKVYMHREIMQAGEGEDVDHRDHDTLRNVRSNLRKCSRSQNMANAKGLRVNNKSGVAGVYLRKDTGKWAAQITVNGRTLGLGSFADKNEAIRIRAEAALHHFGEFAAAV
jgi:hypothetical protein